MQLAASSYHICYLGTIRRSGWEWDVLKAYMRLVPIVFYHPTLWEVTQSGYTFSALYLYHVSTNKLSITVYFTTINTCKRYRSNFYGTKLDSVSKLAISHFVGSRMQFITTIILSHGARKSVWPATRSPQYFTCQKPVQTYTQFALNIFF